MSPTRPHAAALPARLIALLIAAAALSAPGAGAAAAPVMLDLGRFTLSQDGQPARVEDFAFQRFGDSLVVRAASAPWRAREDDLRFDKHMMLVAQATEYDLISYQSQYATERDTLRRGISLARGDTAFTLWREHNGRGTGDVATMPPGRMYVLDAPLFTLFGYIGWTMQGRVFESRPIQATVLGARDTVVEATVTDAGTQELTWNGQAVTARKLLIGDRQTTVAAWFAPDGRMLRLEQPEAGIRAERDAPPAEPEPARREEPPPGK